MGRISLLGVGDPAAAPPPGGGGGPAVSGLISVWRADTGVTTSGGNVTVVADQVGSNNLTNSGTVPFNATGYNGHPTFAFNKSGLLKTAAGFPMGADTTCSWWFIGQMLADTGNYGVALSYAATGQASDWNNTASAVFCRASSDHDVMIFRDSLGASTGGPSLNVDYATNFRFLVVFSGTSTDVYINNTLLRPGNPSTAFGATGVFRVGGQLDTSADSYNWSGPISEIGVSGSALDSTERATLDAYLTAAWGT